MSNDNGRAMDDSTDNDETEEIFDKMNDSLKEVERKQFWQRACLTCYAIHNDLGANRVAKLADELLALYDARFTK